MSNSIPNWQHHSKKEPKRTLKPQALRQARQRLKALKAKLNPSPKRGFFINKNKMPHPVRRAIRVQQKKEAFREWKEANPCVDCGKHYPHPVMDLHHLDPSTKDWDITRMIKADYGPKRIKEEIDKCVLLCSNCHRLRHHKERMESNELLQESLVW